MTVLVSAERIENLILFLRGYKVILDSDLADLYQVEVKQLKRQVRRNQDRFPADFMFALTKQENESLRRQIGTLKRGEHAKYLPYAFTEQGVAMLSSVLNSKRAVQVNIEIMRAFVQLRQLLASNSQLARKLDALEKKYDAQSRWCLTPFASSCRRRNPRPGGLASLWRKNQPDTVGRAAYAPNNGIAPFRFLPTA